MKPQQVIEPKRDGKEWETVGAVYLAEESTPSRTAARAFVYLNALGNLQPNIVVQIPRTRRGVAEHFVDLPDGPKRRRCEAAARAVFEAAGFTFAEVAAA